MNKRRKAIIEANQVSELKTVTLGGYPQQVLIEGKRKDLPIVITLHGGPGTPIPFSIGCRGLFPDFTDKYIMVYWDQYGCGKNNHVIDDTFHISSFVDMTIDLVKEVKRQYPENRLYLFAMSWGTVLSANTINKIPKLIDGVLAYGQVHKELVINEEVQQALHNSDATKKVKDKFDAIYSSKDYTPSNIKFATRAIAKYTDGYQNKSGEKSKVGNIITGILTSPDYSLKDFIAMVKNGYANNETLLQELSLVDTSKYLKEVTVPYWLVQGDSDIVTSTNKISKYVSECDNKYLTCTITNNAGHMPDKRAMDIIIKLLDELTKHEKS